MANKCIETNDGTFITISEAARITNTAFVTIQRWFNVEKIKTISGLIHRNKHRDKKNEKHYLAISHGRSVFHVTDDNGFTYSTRDLSSKLNISVASARDYIVRCHCRTLQDCLDRKAKMDTRRDTPPKRIKNKSKTKKYIIRKTAEPIAEYVPPINKREFTGRTIHCIRDGIRCENYTYCQNYRLDHDRHSQKYKASGCYSKPDNENFLHTNSNHGGEIPNCPSQSHGGFSS